MKKKVIICLLLSLLIVLSLGCSTAAPAATQTPTPAVTATAAATPAPTPLTDKNVVILTCIQGTAQKTMTLGQFQALTQETRTLSYTNSKGVTTTGSYTGVSWSALKNFFGITTFTSLKVTASDNYVTTLTKEVGDSQSIWAFQKDGKQVASSKNGYLWFIPGPSTTANYLCKFIVTIEVVK